MGYDAFSGNPIIESFSVTPSIANLSDTIPVGNENVTSGLLSTAGPGMKLL